MMPPAPFQPPLLKPFLSWLVRRARSVAALPAVDCTIKSLLVRSSFPVHASVAPAIERFDTLLVPALAVGLARIEAAPPAAIDRVLPRTYVAVSEAPASTLVVP